MSRTTLLLETLESRTVLSTLAPVQSAVVVLGEAMSESEIRVVTPPGLGWLHASEQGQQNGFRGFENGKALGWLKHDQHPGKGDQNPLGDKLAPVNSLLPGKSESTPRDSDPSGSQPNSQVQNDGSQKTVTRKPSQEEMGPPLPPGYAASSIATASPTPASTEPGFSVLAGAPKLSAPSSEGTPVIAFAADANAAMDEAAATFANKSEEQTASDPSARPLEAIQDEWMGVPAWMDVERLMPASPLDIDEEATLAPGVLVETSAADADPLTDVVVAQSGLEQAIQGFLDDLDGFLNEVGRTLGNTPVWVLALALTAGVGTAGLARKKWNRRQAVLAASPSWVPGLPPPSSQKS